jgi:transposase
MRKAIDGLAALVEQELELNPFEASLFVFINKKRDKLKCLAYERNGFWLLYKRVAKQRFHWPDWFDQDSITLNEEQLIQLLDGYNLNGMRPHNTVYFQSVL